MSYKIILLPFIILFTSATYSQTAKIYHLQSPDGKTEIEVSTGKNLSWSVKQGDAEVLTPSELSLELSTGETLGHDARIKKVEVSKEDGIITTPFYKKGQVRDNYNQLKLSFKSDYALIFRAYNDGVAYRFITTQAGLIIKNEQAEFNFKDDDKAYLPFVNDFRNHSDPFNTSFEALYNVMPISAVKKDSLAFLPVLVDLGNNKKAVILEADIEDYPGMYLGAGNHGLKGVFAPYPIAEGLGGYHNINLIVNNRADYIAKSVAFKSYPWRVVIISNNDAELLNNDMVQRLASPSRVADISWIKPGKVAWDWWNDWNISHVNFKAGINDDTYKYYIDFASANKLEYIIIDEGWSSETDLTKISPALNLEKLVEYGKQKNVNIILWASWYAITRDLEGLMSKYEQLGIKGFKVDFIDRDDQPVTKSLYEIAAVAAKHHLLIDYHGMYKPSGMQRTFPNVINFEGVKGLENVKWGVKDHPVYDVTMPFIRMLAGPLDYTPGAMRNATKSAWRAIGSNPQSQGTRCHQLAMYTIFEAPLQMLADNPTAYKREQESTDFIAAVPTTFDETVAITGKVSEYACIARRKGTTWFAGAMTNWDDRTITVDLSFLGSGKYSATIFEDGINADHDATDYKRSVITVTSSDKLNIKMASGGGWSARFEKL
jgi:alpha-glucosidase